MQSASQAYGKVASQTLNPRDLEAHLLLKAASKLQSVRENWDARQDELDGASTPLVHVVDAGSESAMKTGMRVRARWAENRVGAITDIAAFVPEA